MKVSRKALIETLRKCDGIASQTANALGISPQAVRKRIRTDKVLQAIADEAKESLIDLAQSKLRPALDEGDFRAIKFVLETLGRGRGFGKEIKIETDDKPGVLHMYFPDDGRDKPDPFNLPAEPSTVVDGEATTLQNSAAF